VSTPCSFFVHTICLECSLGYYGYNSNKSYDGCLTDACDSEFGICIHTSGGNPGWQAGHEKHDLGIVESNKCMHELAYKFVKNLLFPGGPLSWELLNTLMMFCLMYFIQ
jgi:hypothetical protein